jgi:hypothetical protein
MNARIACVSFRVYIAAGIIRMSIETGSPVQLLIKGVGVPSPEMHIAGAF